MLAQPSAADLATKPWLSSQPLKSYTHKVDTWGIGVLIYEALTGSPPFSHPTPELTALLIQCKSPPPLPAGTSLHCLDFVQRALSHDPAQRASAVQLLQHDWVKAHMPAMQTSYKRWASSTNLVITVVQQTHAIAASHGYAQTTNCIHAEATQHSRGELKQV